jgi:hypothetical protein
VMPPISTGTITQPAMARTKTLTPSLSPMSPDPIRTPTPVRSPKPTGTPSPSLSPADLTTNKAKLTENAAFDAQSTVEEEAFKARLATDIAVLPECSHPMGHDFSPDGNWVAIDCFDDGLGVYNLKDLTTAWMILPETFWGNYRYGPHPGAFFPKHWSDDGKYLYFCAFPMYQDGPGLEFSEGVALLRLDLITGIVSHTIAPGGGQWSYFSFSPGDTYLAYIQTFADPLLILNILNMNTGEERQISLGDQYVFAGSVVWSPDSNRIVLIAAEGDRWSYTDVYILLIDLAGSGQIVLAEKLEMQFEINEWTADNNIILQVSSMSDFYFYNLDTHEINLYMTLTPYH